MEKTGGETGEGSVVEGEESVVKGEGSVRPWHGRRRSGSSVVRRVLELEDLVPPAGPAWLEAPGKHLQTPSPGAHIGPQYL